MNAGFLSMHSTHRNLYQGNEEVGRGGGRAGGKVQNLNGDVEEGQEGRTGSNSTHQMTTHTGVHVKQES